MRKLHVMRNFNCSTLFASTLLTAVLAAPNLGQAQQSNVDSDNDGIVDSMDVEPCNSSVSARVFVPADRVYGMLLFEDQWPNQGDFDFNDAVLAYNQTLRYDSTGQLTGFRMDISVLAVGARFQNGLALRLPGVPASDVAQMSSTVTGGNASVLLDPTKTEATFVFTDDMHSLYGADTTREWINTDPSLPRSSYAQITLDVDLSQGAALAASKAPFDIYIFNNVAGTEVHRPEYTGTANLDSSLFGTADDGSTATRAFVTKAGIPFVLNLPELANYPAEGESIDSIFPEVVPFGASSGTQNTQFYRNLVSGKEFGLTAPAALVAAAAADQSCFTPNPGICGAASGVGSVATPTNNLCGFGTASAASSSGGLWRWTCSGDYSAPTNCTAADYVCQPNLSSSCAISGGTGNQTCNGSGTGYGTCTLASCNSGFYASGNACIAQACSPGSSAACGIANGTGTQTCDNIGSAYGACTVASCNSGYHQSGNSCVLSASCSDGIQNQSETGVDCGGPCSACQSVVGGFGGGQLGPSYSGWTQCAGYYDRQNIDDIPKVGWADACTGQGFTRVRVACGSNTAPRYIDVSRNVFETGLNSYPEVGLIYNGNFAYDPQNYIYSQGNHPNRDRSWWANGRGCSESSPSLTINNVCSWDASNCFGQNLTGPRYLFVYGQ